MKYFYFDDVLVNGFYNLLTLGAIGYVGERGELYVPFLPFFLMPEFLEKVDWLMTTLNTAGVVDTLDTHQRSFYVEALPVN